jgi:hypothetical protein
LTQVVNPLDFQTQGEQSPEGQAFVVLAYAGYNDWKALGSQGGDGKDLENGALRGTMHWASILAACCVALGLAA